MEKRFGRKQAVPEVTASYYNYIPIVTTIWSYLTSMRPFHYSHYNHTDHRRARVVITLLIVKV